MKNRRRKFRTVEYHLISQVLAAEPIANTGVGSGVEGLTGDLTELVELVRLLIIALSMIIVDFLLF